MTYPIYNMWDDIAPTPEEEAQGVRDALLARGLKVGDAQRLREALERRCGMTETTQHTPADVRERVARECVEEAERLRRWYGEGYAKAQRLLREAAAILRTPRGEGEAWCAFLDALDEFEEVAASLWVDPQGPTAEDMERLDRARQRVIECGRALAGIR